jgi:hypothetical protein
MRGSALPVLGLAFVLAACGHHRPPPDDAAEPRGPDFHAPVEILLGYDFNHDGTITRAEMETGLKADFDAADTNHDGRLDEDEVRAVNQKRWSDNASTSSPLVDWNHDGYVDFNEFAATARSLFDEMDRNGDGKLTPDELNPRGSGAKPQAPSGGGEHHHRGGGGSGG